MQSYSEVIQTATGATADEAAVLERIIRAEHPTLDGLSRRELTLAARDAVAVRDYLAAEDPDVLAFYQAEAVAA